MFKMSKHKIFTNRVEASILSQGVGNDLERLSEGLEAVGVSASESIGVLHQLPVMYYVETAGVTGD